MTNNTIMGGKVEVVFNQVDDHVVVDVNGHSFTQKLIKFGKDPIKKDITPYLNEGKNRIDIKATNGMGWAVFKASLTDNGSVMHQWHHESAHAKKDQVFLSETLDFYYREGHLVTASGGGFWLHIDRVDDHLDVIINDVSAFKHGLTHHGGRRTTYNLTPKLKKGNNHLQLELYNGPAFAIFHGFITKSPTPSTEVEYVVGWGFEEAAGKKNQIVFKEEMDLYLE